MYTLHFKFDFNVILICDKAYSYTPKTRHGFLINFPIINNSIKYRLKCEYKFYYLLKKRLRNFRSLEFEPRKLAPNQCTENVPN